jgi:dTDP-4-dehydrorhamnose 3,5-epimerase
MKLTQTILPEVVIIDPQVFGDDRGWFMETFNEKRFHSELRKLGLPQPRKFVQDNHSKSGRGILRGLHYQFENTQGKLVRVVRGEVFDVAVDLRKESPNFGKWVGEYISGENKRQLWIPEGFAHGFLVLSEEADFEYKCTDYYNPSANVTLKWDDSEVDVKWPIGDINIVLSEQDQKGLGVRDILRNGLAF